MIRNFQGPFQYDFEIITNWASTIIGVYYCGYIERGLLFSLYVGKATSDKGIRSRLLDHIRYDNWPGVTHFGYHECSTPTEADSLEASEIQRCKPRYNQLGK